MNFSSHCFTWMFGSTNIVDQDVVLYIYGLLDEFINTAKTEITEWLISKKLFLYAEILLSIFQEIAENLFAFLSILSR